LRGNRMGTGRRLVPFQLERLVSSTDRRTGRSVGCEGIEPATEHACRAASVRRAVAESHQRIHWVVKESNHSSPTSLVL